ncbi:hypothetical protein AVEN_203835-1, partial [Araneus ventricosus]
MDLYQSAPYRTPPHAAVPDAITATEPVDWMWDNLPHTTGALIHTEISKLMMVN